jgi:hypothetical protein
MVQVVAVGGRSTGIIASDSFRHISVVLILFFGLIIEYRCESKAVIV